MSPRSAACLVGLLASLAAPGHSRPPAEAPELGRIEFPTSAGPAAQEAFLRGVLLLHSFEFADAADAFREAQARQPGFALAHWGEALTHYHPLWNELDLEAGRAALARLALAPAERERLAPPGRERDLLAAVEALYEERTETPQAAYAEAMAHLHEAYPDDAEVISLRAMALLGATLGKRDHGAYMRAAALADEVFEANPRHPGAAHYLIHSFDDPVHAPLGLRAARAYAAIAPAAPHAQHMPSHIFLALGLWDEVAASNEVSWQVSEERVARRGLSLEERGYHALLWRQYAYLQLGRYREARQLLDLMAADAAESGSSRTRYHHAALQAAYFVETRRWSEPLADVPTGGLAVDDQATVRFTAGWRALERRDLDAAASERRHLDEAVAAAAGEALEPWKQEALERARILEIQLDAGIALAHGDGAAAVARLEEAARREEAVAFGFGPPSPAKPSHELLAETLLDLGRAEEAADWFGRALERAPRRALSLLGLARASAQSGDLSGAAEAYSELRRIWREADAELPELAEVGAEREGFGPLRPAVVY